MQGKEGLQKHLSLAYYANQMSVYFKTESIIAHAISFFTEKQGQESVTLDQIYQRSTIISEILQNEFLNKNLKLDEQDLVHQLEDSVKRKWYVLNSDGTFSLPKDTLFIQYHQFFKNLSQSYIDSYLIVALTLSAMGQVGGVMEQRSLVNEIHIAIQEIFHRGGIRFMSSCIIEILNTSIGRFSQLGVCQSETYNSQSGGGKVTYIKIPVSGKGSLERYVQILSDISSSNETGFIHI
jgi:hypothetical protein